MYKNKRAELWGTMKEWLKEASLPQDRVLKSDLCGPQYKFDSMGAIQLEGKKEMKARGLASPDAADAIAITFAFPVASREYRQAGVRRSYTQTGVLTSWMGA